VWFQNRRAKWRKRNKTNLSQSTTHPMTFSQSVSGFNPTNGSFHTSNMRMLNTAKLSPYQPQINNFQQNSVAYNNLLKSMTNTSPLSTTNTQKLNESRTSSSNMFWYSRCGSNSGHTQKNFLCSDLRNVSPNTNSTFYFGEKDQGQPQQPSWWQMQGQTV